MINKSPHIIRAQEFLVSLENQEDAYSVQSDISLLQDSRIASVIESIMDRYSEENSIIQFNQVVLDLGTIDKTNYKTELVNRIEEELINFFNAHIPQNGNIRNGERIVLQEHKLKRFEHFLTRGYLEWNASVVNTPSILLKELLQEQKEELVQLLTFQGKKEIVRRRMIYQFTDNLLEQVVEAVAKTESESIITYKNNILHHQEKHHFVDATYSSFRHIVWEVILAYLFVESGSYFNKKAFLQFLIQKIAVKYNLTYLDLLMIIVDGVELEKDQIYHSDFKKIVVELSNDEKKKQVVEGNDPDELSEQDIIALIHEYITKGNLSKQLLAIHYVELNRLIRKLIHTEASFIRKHLNEWLNSSITKKRVLQIFNEANLQEIIKICDFTYLAVANEFIQQIEKLKDKLSEKSVSFINKIFHSKAQLIIASSDINNHQGKTILFHFLEYIEHEFDLDNEQFFLTLQEIILHLSGDFKKYIERYTESKKHQHQQNETILSFEKLEPALSDIQLFIEKNEPELWHFEINKKIKSWAEQLSISPLQLIQSMQMLLGTDFISLQLDRVLRELKSTISNDPGTFSKSGKNGLLSNNRNLNPSLSQLTEIELNLIQLLHKELVKSVSETSTFSKWLQTFMPVFKHLSIQFSNKTAEVILNLLIDFTSENTAKQRLFKLRDSNQLTAQIKNVDELTNFENRDLSLFSEVEANDNFLKNDKSSNTSLTQLDLVEFNLIQLLHKQLLKTISENKSFSFWLQAFIPVLQNFTKQFSNKTPEVVLSLLADFTEEKIAKQRLFQLKNSNQLKALIRDLNHDNLENLKNRDEILNIVSFVIQKGKFPWWVKSYSKEQYNRHFEKLLQSKKINKDLLISLLRSTEDFTFIQLLNNNNFSLLMKQMGNGDERSIELITEIQLLFTNSFIAIGAISKSDFIELMYPLYKLVLLSKESLSFSKLIKTVLSWLEKHAEKEMIVDEFLFILKNQVKKAGVVDAEIKKYLNPDDSIFSGLIVSEKEIEHIFFQSFNNDKFLTPEKLFEFNTTSNKKWLKHKTIRNQLIINWSEQERETFVHFYLDNNQKTYYKEAISLFKVISKQLSSQQYNLFIQYYYELLLLSIANNSINSWEPKKWGQILYLSLKKLLSPQKSNEVLLNSITQIHQDLSVLSNQSVAYIIYREILDLDDVLVEEELSEYKKLGEKEPKELINPLFIKNAGLIILAPYIGTLFERAGILEHGKFKTVEDTYKGVHLLEYAASGKTGQEEHDLVINKILCGLFIIDPVDRQIKITKEEKELVDGLLYAVTQNWSVLKGTSVDGLRTSFLQREGKLIEEEEQYYLKVEEKAFDMLIDQIPWNINQIKYSWMKKIIQIEWRP